MRERSTSEKFKVVTPKTVKIMLLFLGIPYVIAIGWLALPLEYKAPFIISVIIYYIWLFFAW
jgi:hypothetical protein